MTIDKFCLGSKGKALSMPEHEKELSETNNFLIKADYIIKFQIYLFNFL